MIYHDFYQYNMIYMTSELVCLFCAHWTLLYSWMPINFSNAIFYWILIKYRLSLWFGQDILQNIDYSSEAENKFVDMLSEPISFIYQMCLPVSNFEWIKMQSFILFKSTYVTQLVLIKIINDFNKACLENQLFEFVLQIANICNYFAKLAKIHFLRNIKTQINQYEINNILFAFWLHLWQ